jgi:hypothetical protein
MWQQMGLRRRVLVRFFMTMVTHVLAIDGHRRGRSFGRGRMPFVVSATRKSDKRKCRKAGENKMFNHISVLKLVPLARRRKHARQSSTGGLRGGGCCCRCLSHNDFGRHHLIAVLRVIDGNGSARFHRFTRNGITVFIDVGCRL